MKVSDERWCVALEALQQKPHRPHELIRVLLLIDDIPDWVREELALWVEGELPPDMKLSPQNKKLLRAVIAYRRGKKPGEKRAQRIERVASEYGVETTALQNYLDGKGGTYSRIHNAV